jgi:cytochrome b561
MANNERYSTVSVALHWLVALLIIAAFSLGWVMTDMKISPTKLQYYSYHKWIGVTVLALVALRLLNRLLSKAPDYPAP